MTRISVSQSPRGGGRLLASAAGLHGHSVSGTLVAAAADIDDALLGDCRRIAPTRGEGAVTRLPEVPWTLH